MGMRIPSSLHRFRGGLIVAALLTLHSVFGQAMQNDFFPTRDLMRIGVYYYPEAWPESQWGRDIENIKKLGMEYVHMGEFAWSFMEPEEGKFDFSWLEKNVELCQKQGLKVILCTPSPTPPVWLVRKHPEVFMVDAKGRLMDHGSRQHACWTVHVYREYVGKIVSELGKRFGQNPAVWGWQLDNELSHYGKEYCYCDHCQTAFRRWLETKYKTIDRLNEDWGNAFWSQRYQDFEQVRIPNQEELVQQVNPHALLDFQRWFAVEAADYLRFQTATLRKFTKSQWITHNFMNMHAAVSPPLSGKDLDLISWTLYPVRGLPNAVQGPLGFRLGDGAEMSFMHDFLRPINGFQGLMELQPGQVNWADVNPQPYPGAVYLWILRAFAAGAKVTCTYRYRQPLYGGELYHYGLVGPDGVTVSSGGEQYSKAAKDMLLLRQNYSTQAKEPAAYTARRTALLYDVENRWDIDNHKQTVLWDTQTHLFRAYRGLKRLGCPVDVISAERDFSSYPVVVAPAYQLVDETLVARWRAYVEKGGNLVLTCRTAQKDRRGHLWEASWAGPILDLIGAKVSLYDVLPLPVSGTVKCGKSTCEWNSWGEVLEPGEGTTVLATFADQFYAGKPCVVTRTLGKGTVTYVGVDSVKGDLEALVLRAAFERAGIPVANYPDNLFVDWRDGFWVATNFTSEKQNLKLPKTAKMLLGKALLPVAGVAVWTE